MKKYELMYVLVNNISDEEKDALIEKVSALITKNNGVIESTEKLGTKKLAYEIDKKREGFYVLTNFEAEASAPALISNTLRITDGILRFIVVAK
ncbi:MAG: 30S ribosomal protein S6 [Clostridia bacterium]|nr:30S ribosomal protein S6 [Clostridia bacterium]